MHWSGLHIGWPSCDPGAMKSYPVELRPRIVVAVAGGMAQTEAARVFAVSTRTIRRSLVQQRQAGLVRSLWVRPQQTSIMRTTPIWRVRKRVRRVVLRVEPWLRGDGVLDREAGLWPVTLESLVDRMKRADVGSLRRGQVKRGKRLQCLGAGVVCNQVH